MFIVISRSNPSGMAIDLKTHVGNRISLARKEARMTQAELASAIGKSVETVSNAERGQTAVAIQTLEGFARALGVEPSFFVQEFGRSRRKKGQEISLLAELDFLASRLDRKQLQMLVDIARIVERSNG